MNSQEWATRLANVARIYRIGAKRGRGTIAVEEHFGVSRSTAGAWIGRARAAGLLEGVDPNGLNQKALDVAAALGVDYEDLVNAVRDHAGGDLRVKRD